MKNKPFQIVQRSVLEAYKAVRKNKGAPGYDQMDFETFEKHLMPNLYKIWNRMSSGSYFPSPVLAVEIPKKNGKMRRLGIPTIEDRVAQMVVLKTIEDRIDPKFHPDSYGYRPKKSALDAVGTARKRCWDYPYVVELDIKGLFDNIDHELLMKAVRMHVTEKWALLYIERWLKAPFIDQDGNLTPREAGTPQGGVISPILANLFMHYGFDMWMAIHHPEAPFERYADDALIHCRTREEAERIKSELAERFAQIKLEMNEEKTRIAYCKSSTNTENEPITQFDFLGYTFSSKFQKCRDGKYRITFSPKMSKKAGQFLRDKIKRLKLHRMCGRMIEQIAEIINPIVRGFANYFGRFCPSAMKSVMRVIEDRIVKWAMKKHKLLRGHKLRAYRWLERIRERNPELFEHWKWLYGAVG